MPDTVDMHSLTKAAETGQPQAQYRLGALYFSRGEINPALDWLSRAAENHMADAQNLLGIIYLNGIGIPCQPQKAAGLFRVAAEQGLKEAHFNLAGLLFYGSTAEIDDIAACRHLLQAAELKHRPALRVLGYLYSLAGNTNSQVLAAQCLATAAVLGDVHSEYALGMCYLQGSGVGINPDEGAYWLMRAANKGLYCAGLQLKPLIKNIGDARIQHICRQYIPEAKQLAEHKLNLRDLNLKVMLPSSSRPGYRSVSEFPRSLADDICDYLVNLAAPQLAPSGVVDPNSGKPLKTNLRTSSSMNFSLSMYDMVVGFTCRRLAALAGMRAAQAEPVSVLRYLPGEEYKPHYDHFAVDGQGKPRVQDANGQRLVTVFVYLNDVEEGGETDFPRLNVRVRPSKGKAVAFLNCDADGKPDADTLHAGLPVIRGEKWLATLWFREQPFQWI